ncbi:MAG: methylmalonyl-CoA mutase family protein [Terracidiphilus sp.]
MTAARLLEEFPPVSTADWEAAIARDLKGADYEKKLIWRTDEGIAVKPYYRGEDLAGVAGFDVKPGEFPYRRGAQPEAEWKIREEIEAAAAEEANRAACAAVRSGAEEIAFSRLQVRDGAELEVALANLDGIGVHFEHADSALIAALFERLGRREHAADGAISTGCDPLADADFAAQVIARAPHGFAPFTLDAGQFEEDGANAVEEIGLALAAGANVLAEMDARGVSADRTAAGLGFRFAIGANFFFQIAKLRAFRLLWARVVESFGGTRDAARTRIVARTSRWNKTVYDSHVNILRATTEAISAVLGGANSIIIAAFDECYKAPDEASRRLARNTQLLLRHEAMLERVADPGGGAYYVEALTDSIAREAWKLLQEIEAGGGFNKLRAEGGVAERLARSRAAREKAAATRKRVFTGTSLYANPAEHALERIDFERMNAGHRGARVFEELRLRTERHAMAGGRVPQVLLAEIGDARMRGARSHFAANFCACAGFRTTVRRFKNAEVIAGAEADLIVLCSSDAEYEGIAAKLMAEFNRLGRETPVIVAGNSESAEALKSLGVADFVHVRSNPIEVLTRWQERLGIAK